MLNRAQAIGLSAAAAAAFATPGRTFAADNPSIQVLQASDADASATPSYAVDRGFFTKAGLDAKVTVLANGGVTLQGLIGGSAEIAGTSVTNLALAHLKGIPIVAICSAAIYSDKAPTSELLVAKDSPLRTAHDLVGKTIAVNGLNTNSHIATMAWLDKNGGDSKATKYIEFNYSAMVPALEGGRVDAALFIEPALTVAKKNLRVFAHPYDAIGSHFYLGVYCARTAWLAEKPDVARKFVAAMNETGRWANGHQTDSLQILARNSKLDPASLSGMTRAVYAEGLSASEIQPVIDVSVKYGTLAAGFPAREIMWS